MCGGAAANAWEFFESLALLFALWRGYAKELSSQPDSIPTFCILPRDFLGKRKRCLRERIVYVLTQLHFLSIFH